jgi:hypothetical protein
VAIRLSDYRRYRDYGETYLKRMNTLPPDAKLIDATFDRTADRMNIIYESDRFEPVSEDQSPPVIYTWDVFSAS